MTALHAVPPAPTADLPALAAWVKAESQREARLFWAGKAWWVELFSAHRTLASVGHADPQVALGMALEQVGR